MTHLTTLDGTPVSRLTFGTMQFGGKADAKDSRAMFDAARAVGINHFDTAFIYTDGASETLLGPMLKPDRASLFLATKAAFDGGATRASITAQVDMSRKRMAEDYIDLLYLHRWDPQTPLEESFATLADLQAQGVIRHIAVSNYAAWQVMKAQAVAAGFGTRIDAVQPMYNLVKRQAEVEIFPMAQDQQIALIPYSPLGGGLLTGKYAQGGTGRLTEDPRYKARYDQSWMHETAKALDALAASRGVHPATLAVAWAAAHPAGPMPIISASSSAQLGPSLDAAGFAMTSDLYARITALSVTPAPATDRLEEAT